MLLAALAPLFGIRSLRAASPGIRFTDVTREAGIDFRHVNGALGSKYLVETTGSGAAFLDFDRDGNFDLFLVNGGNTPGFSGGGSIEHALYRNHGDGTFSDVSRKAGILSNRSYGMGAAVGDYNNDGYSDLLVTHFGGPNLLYRNSGDGTFTEVSADAGVRGKNEWSSSAAFLDYDRDGDLDLYVVHYLDHSFTRNYICPLGDPPVKSYCSPNVYRGVPDALFRNNGDGTFTDVSREAGIAVPEGKGLGVVAGDYDGDGWTDIYVANDQVRNFLFHNNKDRTFREVGMEMGVALDENGRAQAGMGTDMADFDSDGLMDIIVSNLDTEYLALYRNRRTGGFADASARMGLKAATSPFVGFGVRFVDFDNDGWLDIFLANGHVLDNIELLRPAASYRQRKVLLRNTGQGFDDVTALHGNALLTQQVSRGAAFGDYDNDGDTDVLINNCGGRPQLLRNDGGNLNGWLALELRGSKSNRDGIGAQVEVLAGDRRRVFQVLGGGSYLSAHDRRIHVGLGRSSRADEIIVRWPSSLVDRLQNVNAGQFLTIREGRGAFSAAGGAKEEPLQTQNPPAKSISRKTGSPENERQSDLTRRAP
ncbi:MAG: CRTAC1 family protein [Bryobacteraceae bacterium]